MATELCEEDRIAQRVERHRAWIQRGLRGLWWRRTLYKPGFGVCSCDVCVATRLDAGRCQPGEIPRIGSPVAGCLYVNREKVFADRWRKEHEWQDLAQLLACRPLRPGERQPFFWGMHTPVAFFLTYRERVLCATVIQWLGSNVGFDFLRRCLERCGYRIVKMDREGDL